MEWLGIDPVQVRAVGRRLVVHAATGDELRARVAGVGTQVGFGLDVLDPVGELADGLRELAKMLSSAANTIDRHVFRFDPRPELPFTAASQLASHNTYRSGRSVAELYRGGVRGFEFDLHGPSSTGRWHVHHHAFDPRSNVATLREALASVAALPAEAPITVFLDLKDAPRTAHDRRQFDRAIRDAFGERLFTPLDLIARSPGTTTLGEAVARGAWPTFAELEAKVMIVVTGDVEPYRSQGALTSAAFVAAQPSPQAIIDFSCWRRYAEHNRQRPSPLN